MPQYSIWRLGEDQMGMKRELNSMSESTPELFPNTFDELKLIKFIIEEVSRRLNGIKLDKSANTSSSRDCNL